MTRCLILTLLLSLPVSAATYYVDPVSGDDGHGGLSTGDAWKTIVYAEATAANGSTVYLMDGSFGAVTINRAGNSGRASWSDAVTFRPYGGWVPQFTQLTITGDYDRYLIFDDITIDYPDGGLIGTVSVVYIQSGGYVKFTGCTLRGCLGRDPAGDYIDTYSTMNTVTVGNYSEPGIRNIYFDTCEIAYTGQMAFDMQGTATGEVKVTDCTIHDFGASGLLHDRDGALCVYEGNTIYRQVWTWTSAGKSGHHHGSGLHIVGDNAEFLRNRIFLCGTTCAIRAYNGAVSGGFDGGVQINGSYDDPGETFAWADEVVQENTGATGKFMRIIGSTQIEVARATDDTTFNATDDIISTSNPSAIWTPTSLGYTREWGGRTHIIINNNLVYWGANGIYKMELYDLAPGSQVCNNTILGAHTAATGWNYFWYALHNIPPFYYDGDMADVVFANNIFAGHVDDFHADSTVTGNVMWGWSDGGTQTQLDGAFPGNKVYCWSPTDSSGHEVFDVSGNTFEGSADFDSYAFVMPTDTGDGFEVTGAPANLGDDPNLVAGAFPVDFGSATWAPSGDLLGLARDASPDAGAYEYGATGAPEDPNDPPAEESTGQFVFIRK